MSTRTVRWCKCVSSVYSHVTNSDRQVYLQMVMESVDDWSNWVEIYIGRFDFGRIRQGRLLILNSRNSF